MAPRHGKNTRILMDTYDLSTYLRDVTAATAADSADSSTFGTSDKTFVPGFRGSTWSAAGLFIADANTIDPLFGTMLGDGLDHVFTYMPGGPGIGRQARTFLGLHTQYQVHGPVGDVTDVAITAQPDGEMAVGQVVQDPTTPVVGAPFAASTISTWDYLGASGPIALTSVTMAAGVATFVVPEAPWWTSGLFDVVGVNVAGYNTRWLVTGSTSTTITATALNGATGLGAGTGGTATRPGELGGGVFTFHLLANALGIGASVSLKLQHSTDNSTYTDLVTSANGLTDLAPASALYVLRYVVPVQQIHRYTRLRISAGSGSGNFTAGSAWARH